MIMREMESAPIPGRDIRADNIKKNKWNTNTGSFGTDAMIDKWDINIDTSYQRNISDSRVRAIAREWRWEGVGKLVVAEREDGRLFIVDGQHRLIAARKRSDVQHLPCLVYKSNSVAEEADIFLLLNTGRGPMRTLEKFKSLVMTGNTLAIGIKGVAEDLGLVIPEKSYTSANKNGKDKHLLCVAALLKAWAQNPVIAEKSLRIAKEIAVDRGITKELFAGIFTLAVKLNAAGDNITNHSNKLIEAGFSTVTTSIKNQKIVLGYGGENVYAAGILAVINKGKKNRIVINGIAA